MGSRLPPAGLAVGGRFASWTAQQPQWVLLDVDGTLVAADGVRPAVREAARAAVAAGLRVGLVTGRMRQAALPIIEDLHLVGPHVLHNGAEVHDGTATIATFPLSDAEVTTLEALSESTGTYAELYFDDGFVITRPELRARPHWDLLGRGPQGMADARRGRPTIKATFMCFHDDATEAAVIAGIRAAGLQAGPAHSPVTPGVTYVNATAPGVDKATAVQRAATRLGIHLGAIVAVGDGDNDLPLLRVAGTAIAMGQSNPRVLAAAHLTAPTVDNDGAAAALRWAASTHAAAAGT